MLAPYESLPLPRLHYFAHNWLLFEPPDDSAGELAGGKRVFLRENARAFGICHWIK